MSAARLAIADPPYPMMRAAGGTKQRASRWYGDNPRATSDRPSDVHPDARLWDTDEAHRDLPRVNFIGAKPPEWTQWVLDALSYDDATDTVDDLFAGSGSVAAALTQGALL